MSKALKVVGTVLQVAAIFTGNPLVQIASQVAFVASGVAEQREAKKAQANQGSATTFKADTDAGIPVAYGRVGVAGNILYRVAYDATNRYQTLFCTVSVGPIKSWVSFAADDEVTTFDPTLNKAVDGDHAGFMWLQTRMGAQPDTALTSPTGTGAGVPAPDWTSDYKLSGHAAYALTMFENSKLTEYQGGVVKPLHIIEGVYGWDPRLDSTYPGGSGSCRLNDPTTWVWIENPALAALDWCIGRWAGDSGGGTYGVPFACSLVVGIGSSVDGIDVAAFVNLANVADANGWTVSACPTSKDDKYDVLTTLLQAAGGKPSRKAGKISCVCVAEEQASILTVSAADTAGPVQISLGQSRLERINTILPRHLSEDHRWDMVQLAPISDADWLTEDGDLRRSRGIDYPFVPASDQAAQLAYLDIANAREAITGTIPFKPHMRRIEPGDCFTFDESGFVLSNVKLKCLKRAWDPGSGIVKITFRQETDAKYAEALAQTGTAPPPSDPATPPGPYVEPPTELMASNHTPDVWVNYRNPNNDTFDFVNVYRAIDSTSFGSASILTFYGGGAGEYVPTITDAAPGLGHAYSYWVVAVDIYGNESDPVGPATVTL